MGVTGSSSHPTKSPSTPWRQGGLLARPAITTTASNFAVYVAMIGMPITVRIDGNRMQLRELPSVETVIAEVMRWPVEFWFCRISDDIVSQRHKYIVFFCTLNRFKLSNAVNKLSSLIL